MTFFVFFVQSTVAIQLADHPDSVLPIVQADQARPSTNGFNETSSDPRHHQNHQQQLSNGNGAAATDPKLLNPGPSCRANKGSSSSIPYIDCSDIDSECEAARATRGRSDTNDELSEGCEGNTGKLFGVVNGFYHTDHPGLMQQQQQCMLGNRSVEQSPAPNGEIRAPLHSTPLLDEMFQGRGQRMLFGAGGGGGCSATSRSQCSSPVIGGFHHRTGSLSLADNGNAQPRWHYFATRSTAAEEYGSYSPILPSRTPQPPHFARPCSGSSSNNNNVRNRSDTDPLILSPQLLLLQSRRPLLTTPGSAPTERKPMMAAANGNHLPAPGQARSNTVQRMYDGRRNNNNNRNLNQPVQMIDGSTSSGTESSDSESDSAGGGGYGRPLVYGNPAAICARSGGVCASPMPQRKFSFGSLQLEKGGATGEGEGLGDEDEQGGHYRFQHDGIAGGPVFSC